MQIKDGAVEVIKLLSLFDVSAETIRKDLLSMEGRGLLRRVHGGAVRVGVANSFESLKERNGENADLKRNLSKTAMRFINEGDSIAVDSGSTSLMFAVNTPI